MGAHPNINEDAQGLLVKQGGGGEGVGMADGLGRMT